MYGVALLAAAGIFYVAPWPVLWIPALLALAVLTGLRLDLALLLVPLFVPYFMLPKHVSRYQFAPAEVLIVLDVAAGLGRAWIDRPAASRIYRNPAVLPAVLFLLVATLSTLLAADRHDALEWYRWTVVEPLLYAALCLLYLPGEWRRLLLAIVAGAIVVSAIGLGQYATHQGLSAAGGLQRVEALYGSPDNLGLLLDRAIPIWFGLALLTLLPRIGKVTLWAAGVPLLAVLYLTYSRGAWAAVGIALLVMLALVFPWGRWLLLAVVVLSLGAAALTGPALIHSLQAGHAGTAQRRVDIWTSALHMIRDHPVLGIGPDNFQHYYAPPHQPYAHCRGLGYMNPRDWEEPCLSHPHDEVLDVWLSTGLAGLIAFLWLQVVFWRDSVRLWISHGALALPVMGAMLASLVHGLVDNSYFLPDLAVLFWILIVVATAREVA